MSDNTLASSAENANAVATEKVEPVSKNPAQAALAERITFKDLIMKVLNATAIGIVVALIPNAVLGGLFKYLSQYHQVFAILSRVCTDIQWLVAPMIGFLAGLLLKLNPMRSAIISAAAWIASGALSFDAASKMYRVGLGDLINVMIITALACWLTLLLGDRLGPLTIILQPIIIGAGAGFIGVLILPYIRYVTTAIGAGINSFTTLQPLLMCVLIAMSFSVIIISPISTVAIAFAIGINGLASGAANIGVSACAAALVIGSWRVNNAGVTIAIAMGGMKMMMPNLVRTPIILLPILTTSFASGIGVRVLGILGDKISAGFGFAGLVGPIKAFTEYSAQGIGAGLALLYIAVAYIAIPFGVAVLSHILYTKVLKLYKPEIFTFTAA